ncbi:MAG: carboxyltransferase domain-containing protein [Kofleriaceae bacterium]
MRWIALGDRAIRFARPLAVAPRTLVEAARTWPGVIDVVVAAEDVAVYFDREPHIDAADLDALAMLAGDHGPPRELELRAHYDGEDLETVARATALTIEEVCAVHAAATYTVETLGFAPGFAYLRGLDSRLQLPRRATPRARVPAGSIAIARGYTAVYPFDSPGGWHLLGHVKDRMFGDAGALLQHGDRVRFVP